MARLAAGYCSLARSLAARVQRHPFALLLAFSLAYFTLTPLLAGRKLLWYDELYTVHVARLPATADVWAALGSGMDPNPPLNYLATRVACSVLGDTPLAYRLPALVGFFVLSLCLFHFVARRCGRPFACLAVLFAFATSAHSIYAYEARPYGLLLGCTGLALVCWQAATEGSRWARIGLALSLMAAVSTHYYAVLIFVPLGLAEMVRAWRTRRLDWQIALALVIGLTPLLVYFPLVQQARSVLASGFWAKPKWEAVAAFYQKLLEADLLPCVAVLLFLALYPWLRSADREPMPEEQPTSPPLEEIVLVVAFALLPFFGLVLGKLFTGAFSERYVIPAVLGLAIAFAYAARHYARGCPVLAVSVAAILLIWWVGTDAIRIHEMADKHQALAATCDRLARLGDPDEALVVSDSLTFLQLAYYAPEPLARRLTYLRSPELSRRYKGYDTDEVALGILRQWVFLNVADYEDFVPSHRRFLVYDRGSWLPAALVGSACQVTKRTNQLLLVQTTVDAVAAANQAGKE
jgi:hypothetical protein